MEFPPDSGGASDVCLNLAFLGQYILFECCRCLSLSQVLGDVRTPQGVDLLGRFPGPLVDHRTKVSDGNPGILKVAEEVLKRFQGFDGFKGSRAKNGTKEFQGVPESLDVDP